MGNRKYIVVAAVLAMLSTGFSPARAENINLTQVDVKKSSVSDTVDVTFYTTGQSQASVVTRKSNNRYVILLPNISSSSSVTPSLGAVKDLISDVEVKHVNDGIGGYTKVTFSTTKPVNFKTYTKQSAPMTTVQKDYRNIIAQNNNPKTVVEKQQPAVAKTQQTPAQTKPVQAQPKAQAKVEKPVANTSKQPETKAVKPAVQKDAVKTSQKPKLVTVEAPKIAKVVEKKIEQAPKQEAPKTVTSSSDYVPKMKYDENGNRIIDLEPRVSHKEVTESSNLVEEQPQIVEDIQPQVQEENVVSEDNSSKSSHNLPLWMIIAGGAVLSLGVLICVISALVNSSRKRKSLESFFSVSSSAKFTSPKSKYSDIVNDSGLNWQEKYKRYNEKEQVSSKKPMSFKELSYVTNIAGTKQSIIEEQVQSQPKAQEVNSAEKPISSLFAKKPAVKKLTVNSQPQKVLKGNSEEFKKQMRAKIAQLEHSFAQTSTLKEPEEITNEVKSEDNSIISKTSDIKLKSFSKSVSLKEASRGLINDNKKVKHYQEGKFVKLKDSPLSISRRSSASSEINASDLMNKGSKFLINNGEMTMNREKENYLLSSLDEYLSILDSEKSSSGNVSVADSLSQIRPASEPMTRSGVTNPISRGKSSAPYMNGLIVKSGYNIDSEKGFYLVNMDGVSALVGRIKDSTYVLKKFDRVIDQPLQVRQDDSNVYIVKIGRYKCLVDVSKDKMGTLIEI